MNGPGWQRVPRITRLALITGTFGSLPQNSMRSQQNSDGLWISSKVPKREKAEVLAAFAAHKGEVTAGYVAAAKRG